MVSPQSLRRLQEVRRAVREEQCLDVTTRWPTARGKVRRRSLVRRALQHTTIVFARAMCILNNECVKRNRWIGAFAPVSIQCWCRFPSSRGFRYYSLEAVPSDPSDFAATEALVALEMAQP